MIPAIAERLVGGPIRIVREETAKGVRRFIWDRVFVTNKLEVNCAYDAKGKIVTTPKSDRSVRTVDMVPVVRQMLWHLQKRAEDGLVFPGAGGGVFSRSVVRRAYLRAIAAAEVAPIRWHDLRHTFASLLIMAGKHPKYIANQLGHASAAFTLDTYGHLMDRLPVRPVEWIDDLVFPEGFQAALKLHLDGAPPGAIQGHLSPPPNERNVNVEAALREFVQSGATGAWWAVQVLNLRPHPCEGCALPLS
jgi:hypothetical protein